MGKLREALSSVETWRQVDPAAGKVQQQLRRALPEDAPVTRVLTGSWIGHPVHPLVVLVPVGAWVSAGVLDLLPKHREAARHLVAIGLVAAVPAAVAGAAELRELDDRGRRVGFVHALTNLTATACYLASYGLRRGGRPGAGKVAAMLGLVAVSAGGALGGHLTYAQGAGVYRWQPQRRAGYTRQAAEAPSEAPSEAPAVAHTPVTSR
jgi:O-antigen ligase